MAAKEIIYQLPGQKIAAKVWNDPSRIPVIALHGWLDNAASFDNLAPLLPNAHIIAVDLPGHGHSEHKKDGAFIHFIDFVIDTILLINHLAFEKFALLGHSLGAAIASFIAGTIPNRVSNIVLLDGLGPFTTPAAQAPHRLRTYIEEITRRPHRSAPHYKSIDEALQARLKVNDIQANAALPMIERGLKRLTNGEFSWRTDPKLLIPGALQLTEEQVLAFLSNITAPMCIIRPQGGFPFPEEIIRARLNAIKHAKIINIPGNHHVHMDDPQSVANCLRPIFAPAND